MTTMQYHTPPSAPGGSIYADWGTACHELAAMCLTEGKDAAAYVGRIIKCADYEHSRLGPSIAKRWMACPGSVVLSEQPFVERTWSFAVDEDIVECVQTYVDAIREYACGNVMYVEKRYDISYVLGGDQGGHVDTCILADRGTELQVHDLKTGRHEVFAEKNPQLMLYALGALHEYEIIGDFERVRMVIHQPRVKHGPEEWVCTVDELRAFAAQAKTAADLCNDLLAQVEIAKHERGSVVLDGHLNPSEDPHGHCYFCPAKPICPALQRQVSHDVFDDFDIVANPHETAEPREVPVEPRRLGTLMDRLDLIEDWCRSVRAKGEAEVFNGNPPIGRAGPYKIVQGRKGARAFSDKEAAEAELKRARLKRDEMYNSTLKTPPQLEKMLKKDKPRVWSRLTNLITQSEGKLHVAPGDDPRPAVENNVVDDFEVIGSE